MAPLCRINCQLKYTSSCHRMGEFGLAVFWRKIMGKGGYGGMKGNFSSQPTDTPNVFVHVINQPLNMSPHSAPLMGNLIIMGNNKPLRTLRALRTVFTRKSNGLAGN